MNITPSSLSATILAYVIAFAVPAEAQDVRRVTLDDALALFAGSNLDLRLARADAAEAAARARQAGAFPNPTVAGTHELLSHGGASYSESYASLNQRLEWPGTRAARRESAAHSAAAAVARLESDSVRLAFEVKRAYTEAARAARAESVLERAVALFREGERVAEERYREGDLSRYDLERIRVERTRYETLLAEAELDASAARRVLALLVAPMEDDLELAPVDSLDGIPPTVAPGVALAAALGHRRELAAAAAALASARAAGSVVRGERIPDVVATGGFKRQSDGFSGAVLGLSLPLPLWDRRGGATEAANARVAAAEARVALTRRQIENDVRRAIVEYEVHARRAALMTERTSAGGDADLLTMAQVAYDEGEIELIQLLDAADATREARLAEARLRADLWTAYYDLERALGGLNGNGEGEGGR